MSIITVEHLRDSKRIIEGLIESKAVDVKFAEKELSFFEYDKSKDLQEVRSVILIAYPQAKTRVIIHQDSRIIDTIIPPAYVALRKKRLESFFELEKIIKKYEYQISKALVPEKTLAVRSGLARYGRNNITYIPEFGSFFVLYSFLTDAPLQESTWGEAKMMEQCEKCFNCLKACPTKAISDERFLIHAEKCITAYTEDEGGFPEWIDPKLQETLLGCIRCQQACPVNKDFLDKVEFEIEFSNEDTAAILSNVSMDKLPDTTAQKIRLLGFDPFLPTFAQNMQRVIDRLA